jgi:hypothetical protein
LVGGVEGVVHETGDQRGFADYMVLEYLPLSSVRRGRGVVAYHFVRRGRQA